jgi:hypothetical protein
MNGMRGIKVASELLVSLGRPFRAFVCVGFVTQGDALGYLRADLWSLGRRGMMRVNGFVVGEEFRI